MVDRKGASLVHWKASHWVLQKARDLAHLMEGMKARLMAKYSAHLMGEEKVRLKAIYWVKR